MSTAPSDPLMKSDAHVRDLLAQLKQARAYLARGTDRDRATALVIGSVSGLIEAAVEDGTPLGLLPHRARTLAATVLAEAAETGDPIPATAPPVVEPAPPAGTATIRGDRIQLQYADVKHDAPVPGYHVLITYQVKHMTSARAREVSADLVVAADLSDRLYPAVGRFG